MGGPCKVDGKFYNSMDNFLYCQFVVEGVNYSSAEQYFQSQKFLDEDYKKVIQQEKSGGQTWVLGNTRKYKIRDDWEKVKEDIMHIGNFAKFTQNDKFKNELISTQGKIYAFGFEFWSKWNAIILERIREELRPPNTRNQQHLEKLIKLMEEYQQSY